MVGAKTNLTGELDVENALPAVRNLRLMPVNSMSLDTTWILYADAGISDKCINDIAVADESLASEEATPSIAKECETAPSPRAAKLPWISALSLRLITCR